MSAPVKKTNKIKQRTSTTTIFVKMLSTDLVPVHNDIWRKLPFSSWRAFKPYQENKKVTQTVTLTLTQKCFSTFLPPVWGGTSGVFLHAASISPARHSEFRFEPAWSTGAVPKTWKHERAEPLKRWALRRISRTRKAQTIPEFIWTPSQGFHSFDQLPPTLIKTREGTLQP